MHVLEFSCQHRWITMLHWIWWYVNLEGEKQ